MVLVGIREASTSGPPPPATPPMSDLAATVENPSSSISAAAAVAGPAELTPSKSLSPVPELPDAWESLLRQQGDEGNSDLAVTGVIFQYPIHLFAYFEVLYILKIVEHFFSHALHLFTIHRVTRPGSFNAWRQLKG